jgi:hypothetical protein
MVITLQKSPELFGMNCWVLFITITISYSMCIHMHKTGGTPHGHSGNFLNKPYAQRYADDLALSVTEKLLNAISELMQRALNVVQRLCRARGLADETKLVLFANRERAEGFMKPALLNTLLHTTRLVKYLGFILNAKLTWREHVKQRINEVCAPLWLSHSTLGKTSGLKIV